MVKVAKRTSSAATVTLTLHIDIEAGINEDALTFPVTLLCRWPGVMLIAAIAAAGLSIVRTASVSLLLSK